ncbi:MAG: hypothetical protein PUK21_03985 [Peptostreptococcaceae bacterium]|nr:hypothetical protein [Peptostreptococcaceae bacterium]MDY5739399.1 hypothetical protein [Anaerovoracaceae bacterium]
MKFKSENGAKAFCVLANICVAIWIFLKFCIELFKEFVYFILVVLSLAAVIWTFYPTQTMEFINEFINEWKVTPIIDKAYIICNVLLIVKWISLLISLGVDIEKWKSKFYRVINSDDKFEVIDREK